jgi:hypothetical protein
MPRRHASKKQQDEQAVRLFIAIVVSVGGVVGLITAAKKYEHHQTWGNTAKLVLAVFGLAQDLE